MKYLREIFESRLSSIEQLIHRGGTEGEKSAARAAYKRVTGNDYETPSQAQYNDLSSRTQGWGGSKKSNLFDEDGEVKIEHMDNFQGILNHHGFVKTGNTTWNHPSKGFVSLGEKIWSHTKNGKTNHGLMADTLHDSIIGRKYR